MKKMIAVLPGDGIGPEVINESLKVLEKIEKKFDHQFTYKEGLIGGTAIEKKGNTLPKETIKLCEKADAILFGAIGDPRYDNNPELKVMRPEESLIAIRKLLGLYINIRPILPSASLLENSPLKKEIIEDTDFIIIRELTGGLYYGKRGRTNNGKSAFDTCEYSEKEIIRISKFAFDLARKRKKKITLVDKANVLETSRLWREVVAECAKNFPDITLENMYVDSASMQLIKKPTQFDVILTENMFGDILSDEASVITGSLGMLPSASIGKKTAIYEPIHGSYPKAAGQNIANPIGSILSAAMMLEYSFGLKRECYAIYNAIEKVLNQGYGTKDLHPKKILGTKEFGEKIRGII